MKVRTNNHLDIKQTVMVNAKQLLHDHGDQIAGSIDRFFTSQAGSR